MVPFLPFSYRDHALLYPNNIHQPDIEHKRERCTGTTLIPRYKERFLRRGGHFSQFERVLPFSPHLSSVFSPFRLVSR